jgi:hypothetical protein
MTFSARQLLFRAEDLLSDTLAAAHHRYAVLVGRHWLRHKHQLRGRACHCPPGQPLHLVHSEGLREAADVVVDYGANVRCPGRMQVPVPEVARIAGEIGGGDIVHVKSELIGPFVQHVLPSVSGPVVLVTGDSDYGPVGAFRYLLDDARIAHWFAQNCDVAFRHPKLTRIPIGIDNPRYTKLEKRIGFLIEMTLGKSPLDPSVTRNDMGDQALLQQIAAATRGDVGAKPLRALCTFHMNQKLVPNFEAVAERKEAYDVLKDSSCCHFVPQRVLQHECWRMHAEFAFEVSPRGKGLDCFRTWESLFLGTIPIVKTSTLDPLYIDEGFPVVIVESYREVTADNLARWRDRLAGQFTPAMVRRLTNDYWLDRIRSARRGCAG